MAVDESVETNDCFVRISIKVGPNFWGEHKHSTSREVAEVLQRYAKHYSGALRELFSALAEYHFRVEAPIPFTGTGGPSDNITYGPCQSCTPAEGGEGYTTKIGGIVVRCTPCA